MKKINAEDLRDIFYLAKINITNDNNPMKLSNQEFVTKCYLKAVLTFLNIENVEFEEKMGYSSVDE